MVAMREINCSSCFHLLVSSHLLIPFAVILISSSAREAVEHASDRVLRGLIRCIEKHIAREA